MSDERRFEHFPYYTCPECGQPSDATIVRRDAPGSMEECRNGHRFKPTPENQPPEPHAPA